MPCDKCDCENCVDSRRESFLRHLEECRREVVTWPKWQQVLLGSVSPHPQEVKQETK